MDILDMVSMFLSFISGVLLARWTTHGISSKAKALLLVCVAIVIAIILLSD